MNISPISRAKHTIFIDRCLFAFLLNSPRVVFCPTLLNHTKFCKSTTSINHVSRVSQELSPHCRLLINDNNVMNT